MNFFSALFSDANAKAEAVTCACACVCFCSSFFLCLTYSLEVILIKGYYVAVETMEKKNDKKWNLTVQLTALIIQLINEWVNTRCLPIYHFIYYHILCLDCSSNGTCKLSSAPILCMHFGCAFFAFLLEIKNWENVYCHENTWTYSKWIKDTAHIKFSASRLLYLSLFFSCAVFGGTR